MLRNGLLASRRQSVNAVEWSADADYLEKAAAVTSTAGKFLFSMWIKIDSQGANSRSAIFRNDLADTGKDMYYTWIGSTTDKLLNQFCDGSSNWQVQSSNNSIEDDSLWHHLLISVDYNQSAGNKVGFVYIDDVDVTSTTTDSDAASTYFSCKAFFKANVAAVTSGLNGSTAEIYMTDEFLDISIEANRRKFNLASNRPADLGSDGSTPTGTQPLIYLNGDAASAGTNAGSAGNFTINGSPVDSATNPWS